jgi:hypothetical protein
LGPFVGNVKVKVESQSNRKARNKIRHQIMRGTTATTTTTTTTRSLD